jgi:hypothetical protein
MAVSLIFALPIGIAFGFVLERSGLGDPRKLAAQFTFADFTVLKVMLAAIVTAGLGLFWLARAGLIDPASIYVPPTNLLPQIVGGLVFGVGFALGGYCPGTSCVAAAAGRGDALALIGGLLAGTVVFAEAFPLVEPFYSATPLGAATWHSVSGTSHGWALAALVAIALAVFVAAQRAEGRTIGPLRSIGLAAGAALVGAATAFAGGSGPEATRVVLPVTTADTVAPAPAPAPGWRSAGGCGAP